MRKAEPLPEGTVARMEELLRQARSKAVVMRIQCILLQGKCGMTSEEISPIVGWHASSVRRVQQRYRAAGERVLLGVPQGGRRHENLSLEEERSFLQTFAASGAAGELLEVSQVKLAYEERVGHRVPHSTIYRLLARHGWRKVMPRRRHPDSDAAAQASFKKNGRRWWTKPAPGLCPSTARCG